MLTNIRKGGLAGLLGCVAITAGAWMISALPASATMTLRAFDTPILLTSGANLYIDLDTNTTSFSWFSDHEFAIGVNGLGAPYQVIGRNSANEAVASGATITLLGAGAQVSSSDSFYQYAYFPTSIAPGHYYVGFRTNADIDQNAGTTGTTYGFFDVEVASLTVVGYGFESNPGTAATTSAVPEPVTGILALGAVAGAVGLRRRWPRR